MKLHIDTAGGRERSLRFLGEGGEHFGRRLHTDIACVFVFEVAEVAGDAVSGAVLLCRHLVGILPVTHPGHGDMSAVRCIVERDRSIMVLAPVHPFLYRRIGIAGELMTIECSGEILCSRATERTTGVDVANQNPFTLSILILHSSLITLHFKEIRALPHTVDHSSLQRDPGTPTHRRVSHSPHQSHSQRSSRVGFSKRRSSCAASPRQ